MSFLWPRHAGAAARRAAPGRGLPGAGAAPGAAHGRAGRAGLRAHGVGPAAPPPPPRARSRFFLAALVLLLVGLRPPAGERRPARTARARSSSPSTCRTACGPRTSQPTRMDAAKAAARAFVEKQPELDQDRRRRLQRRRPRHAAADDRQGRRAGRHRPADAARARPRSARASSPRSAPSPASPSAVDPERARRATSPTSTSATTARPPSSCCPTARTPSSPTRSTWPSWRRRPVCSIYPIGIGSAAGHGRRDRRVQRGDRARRGPADARSPSVTDGTYFHAEDAAVAGPGLRRASTCSSRTEPEEDRGHRRRHRHQHRCCSSSAARCRCCGSGGWCSDVVRLAARPARSSLVVPLLLGAYLWQLRRRRKQAVRFSSVALDPRRAAPALALAPARPGRRCSWPASPGWPSPRPGRRSRSTCRSAARRSSSPSTCRARCAPPTSSPTGSPWPRRRPATFVKDQVDGHAHRHRRLRRLRPAGRAAHDGQGRR